MKKILFSVFSLIFLCSSAAYAETNIRVEGEDYDIASVVSASAQTDSGLSGENCLYIWDLPNKNGEYEITYTVNAPLKGTYDMTGVTMRLSANFSTDYYIQVNNDDEFAATERMSDLGRITSIKLPGEFYKYDFGSVKLQKGDNTLKIRLNKNDARSDIDGRLMQVIDYFDFTMQGGGNVVFSGISSNMPSNTYNVGQTVEFTAELSGIAKSEMKYSYEVINSDEEIVNSGDLVFREGSDVQKLYLPGLNADWYRITFYEHGTKTQAGKSKMFSVIKPIFPETIKNNHFAVDTGGYFADKKVIRQQANVAYRNGISFMRERGNWASLPVQKNEKFVAEMEEGMNVLYMFEGGPGQHYYNAGNLFELYDMMKELSKEYGEQMAFEIWNEPDGLGHAPGDLTAAFIKAASIGAADGNPNVIKTNGGLAGLPSDLHNRLLFQNGFMDYVDVFCYHAHESWSGGSVTPVLRASKTFPNMAALYAYDKDKPVWLNESGIQVPVESDGLPNVAAQRAKGSHLLKSTVDSIRMGHDKRFWFLWVHYVEGAKEFGNFSDTNEPYISVNVMNTMVNALKESEYIGPLANLPAGAAGYALNNGEKDVAVLWSNSKNTYSFTGDATAMDMTGKDVKVTSANGVNSVEIADEPIYIIFNNKCPEENYYKAFARHGQMEITTYDDAKRIVIQPIWENQDLVESKKFGYTIKPNEEQKVTIKVYNFGDEAKEGTLNIDCDEEMFIPSATEFNFSVGAMECKDIEMTFKLGPKAAAGIGSDIAITGKLSDGREISSSIGYVRAQDEPRVAKNVTLVPDYDVPSKWNPANRAEGRLTFANTDVPGEIKVTLEKDRSAAIWAYPKFAVEEGSMAGSNGFTFKIKLDSNSYTDAEKKGSGSNLFIYMKDGSSYYMGEGDFISFTNYSADDFVQVTVPWNSLLMWEGNAEIPFDPANITAISVGFHNFTPSAVVPTYILKDLGTYVSDHPGDSLGETTTFSVEGITNNAHYTENDSLVLTANIDITKYSNVKVLLQDEWIYESAAEENMKFDLGKLSRGYYRAEVVAEGEHNFKQGVAVYFYVD